MGLSGLGGLVAGAVEERPLVAVVSEPSINIHTLHLDVFVGAPLTKRP